MDHGVKSFIYLERLDTMIKEYWKFRGTLILRLFEITQRVYHTMILKSDSLLNIVQMVFRKDIIYNNILDEHIDFMTTSDFLFLLNLNNKTNETSNLAIGLLGTISSRL